MDQETPSIIVDLNDLKEMLNSVEEEEYPYVKLEISSDGYNSELSLLATDQDGTEIEYGRLLAINED